MAEEEPRTEFPRQNILFLDIDGVLTSHRTRIGLGGITGTMKVWDPVACGFINRLCNKSPTKIVISSSWRLFKTRRHFSDLLFYNNIDPHHLYDGDAWKTERCGSVRGDEIDLWLKQNPEWDNYVILDDDSDMLDHQREHFVHTLPLDGMMREHYEKTCKILEVNHFDLMKR